MVEKFSFSKVNLKEDFTGFLYKQLNKIMFKNVNIYLIFICTKMYKLY